MAVKSTMTWGAFDPQLQTLRRGLSPSGINSLRLRMRPAVRC